MKRTKLEVAKSNYPKGTRFFSAYSEQTHIATGETIEDHEGNIHDGYGYLYYSGRWAILEDQVISKSVTEQKVSIITFSSNRKQSRRKLITCYQP